MCCEGDVPLTKEPGGLSLRHGALGRSGGIISPRRASAHVHPCYRNTSQRHEVALQLCGDTNTAAVPLTVNFLLQVPAQSKLALLRLDARGTNAINIASLVRAIGIVILDKFPGISVAGVFLWAFYSGVATCPPRRGSVPAPGAGSPRGLQEPAARALPGSVLRLPSGAAREEIKPTHCHHCVSSNRSNLVIT